MPKCSHLMESAGKIIVSISAFLLCIIPGSCKDNSTSNYFMTVTLGEEYSCRHDLRIKKWDKDLKIYVCGDRNPFLDNELNNIITELNALIGKIKLRCIDNPDSANFVIYFGRACDYVDHIEPNAKSYVQDDWGLFWLYWNDKYEIYAGTMYVDTYRTRNHPEQAAHLLREELTQSLGLMNDSSEYPNSIFYGGKSTPLFFMDIDREVIKLLYSDKIKAGMTARQVEEVLNL